MPFQPKAWAVATLAFAVVAVIAGTEAGATRDRAGRPAIGVGAPEGQDRPAASSRRHRSRRPGQAGHRPRGRPVHGDRGRRAPARHLGAPRVPRPRLRGVGPRRGPRRSPRAPPRCSTRRARSSSSWTRPASRGAGRRPSPPPPIACSIVSDPPTRWRSSPRRCPRTRCPFRSPTTAPPSAKPSPGCRAAPLPSTSWPVRTTRRSRRWSIRTRPLPPPEARLRRQG